MLDFTSALYLGLQHPSWSLEPWRSLTTGTPAAFREPSLARRVARELAELQGLEATTLGSSTLHLFWDLGKIFGRENYAIFLDQGTYPIARWGMERAAAYGASLRRCTHFDPASLAQALLRLGHRRPIVVCDGFCPGCGRVAPLAHYLELVTPAGGWLVVDDTQALGIFGRASGARNPYGEGGGGMPAWSKIGGPHVVVVASLAKSFGTPLAALSGSRAFVSHFESQSGTRMHCSPPSLAAIHAGARALTTNVHSGEMLRSRLIALVRRFRHRLMERKIAPEGGLFPVQTLPLFPRTEASGLHRRLLHSGVATVLHGNDDARGPAKISFLINARHDARTIDQAAAVLSRIVTEKPQPPGWSAHVAELLRA